MGRKLLLFASNPFNLNESLKENLSSVAAPRIPRVVVVGNSLSPSLYQKPCLLP